MNDCDNAVQWRLSMIRTTLREDVVQAAKDWCANDKLHHPGEAIALCRAARSLIAYEDAVTETETVVWLGETSE